MAWSAWLMSSLLQEGDRPAERRLPANELPGAAAELDAPVGHLVDLPAQVLDVDHVVGEQQGVHDLQILLGEQLVQGAAEGGLGVLGLAWAGRIFSVTVFIGWSALPASTASHRTPRSSTHSANSRVGPGCRTK